MLRGDQYRNKMPERMFRPATPGVGEQAAYLVHIAVQPSRNHLLD